jgi:hypothetical protein
MGNQLRGFTYFLRLLGRAIYLKGDDRTKAGIAHASYLWMRTKFCNKGLSILLRFIKAQWKSAQATEC